MENFLVILGIAIVLFFIIINYRKYIAYFLKLILVDIKNKKIKQNKINYNIKDRIIENKELNKYISFINSKLKDWGYEKNKKYIIDEELKRKLEYSKFDDRRIQILLMDILNFVRADSSEITLKIFRTSSRNRKNVAGSYNVETKEITVQVSTYTTLDQLIATIAHECTHHILYKHRIKLKDRGQNEMLTDVTAVCLGFGDYFYRAYKDERRIVYNGEYSRIIDGDKLGYIASGDVKYIMKVLKKM